MKHSCGALGILFFALCLFSDTNPAHAKPDPPEGLAEIFADFSKAEEQFKSRKWKEAIGTTDRIHSRFDRVLPRLRERLSGDVFQVFSALMTDFRSSLKKQDMEAAERRYIKLQNLLFTIMDNYAYKVPLVISIIDKYLLEAEQALGKNDFRRLTSEMNEVYDFSFRAESYLSGKGVGHKDLETFRSTIRDVRAAGEAGDAKEAQTGIQALKAAAARYLLLFQ